MLKPGIFCEFSTNASYLLLSLYQRWFCDSSSYVTRRDGGCVVWAKVQRADDQRGAWREVRSTYVIELGGQRGPCR